MAFTLFAKQLAKAAPAAAGGRGEVAEPKPVAMKGGRLNLVVYYFFSSLWVFVLVAMAMITFETDQADFFKSVQEEQKVFFKTVQSSFAKRQDDAARQDLLAIHEAGNVNLTRLFANTLWETDFAPFVARAQAIPVEHCRVLADVRNEKTGKTEPSPGKKHCFAEVGKRIMALPGFAALDLKVHDTMKRSSVFKIKVFDLRGITVYSSERAQIGEDKANNAGWKSAIGGQPASELTHRDKFSAFEGVVENRDLIGSYLPVRAPGSDKIVGVFEVYSDVTQFLGRIQQTSVALKKAALENERTIEAKSAENLDKVGSSSIKSLLVVGGLLGLLYAALFFIMRQAQRTIEYQVQQRERVQQQLGQAEKMASLGQMVAGVAHQLNTPLAYSYNNIQMVMQSLDQYALPLKVAGTFSRLVKSVEADKVTFNVAKAKAQVSGIDERDLDVAMPREMLGDTLQGIEQMRELVENLRDFTRLDRTKVARFDLNKGLHSVVYIAKSVIPTRVRVVEDYAQLPEIECNPSQLNQVFLNLINNAAQAIPGEGTVTIKSALEGDMVRVDVVDTGSGIPTDVLPHIWDNYYTTKPAGEGTGIGLPIARTIVTEHGGDISVVSNPGMGTTFTVHLPIKTAQ